jgi:hypothetical protein
MPSVYNNIMSPCFSSLLGFISSGLAYPNLLGTKGYVVVVAAVVYNNIMLMGSW